MCNCYPIDWILYVCFNSLLEKNQVHKSSHNQRRGPFSPKRSDMGHEKSTNVNYTLSNVVWCGITAHRITGPFFFFFFSKWWYCNNLRENDINKRFNFIYVLWFKIKQISGTNKMEPQLTQLGPLNTHHVPSIWQRLPSTFGVTWRKKYMNKPRTL